MNLAAAIAGAHEAAITADMQCHAVPLDAAECDAIARLRKWCQEIGVSSCPCKPLTLAAFIRSEAALGVAPEEIATTYCGAISELHNHYGHANPTATTPVRLELSRILKLTPPRSWPKKDRLMFAGLPPEARAIIARREEDRDRELRRLQNELAKLKYRHGGAKPAIEEKEITK